MTPDFLSIPIPALEQSQSVCGSFRAHDTGSAEAIVRRYGIDRQPVVPLKLPDRRVRLRTELDVDRHLVGRTLSKRGRLVLSSHLWENVSPS